MNYNNNPSMEEAACLLASANAILFHQGVVDAFGHVSMRHPSDRNRFLLSASMPPARVRPDDIMEHGMDGEPCAGYDQKSYLERYIHSEIYKARPDVGAIVHSHSPSVIPFGIVRSELRPVYHMAAFLGECVPRFDIRCACGDGTDLLVSDRSKGAALANALGQDATVILMRGHGSTAVGADVREAVFHAVYTEINARLQSSAALMGEIEFLSPAEARCAAAACRSQIGRAWDLWLSEASASRSPLSNRREQ